MDFCASSLLSGQVVLYWERNYLLVSAVKSYKHVTKRDMIVSVFAHHYKGLTCYLVINTFAKGKYFD